ncbi:LIM-domain binding protein-domain-containing protein [Kalaharituber pfeilii]|nr:LIM-domain binding protein-domain-containing protein [Kalaharituber pfeilii]
MMAAYPPPHPNQLQHAVTQAPQQIQPGHPGQPTPHAMQHLHPNAQQAFQHQQQMQAAAMANNPQFLQQQQQRLIQRQHMLMNNLTANGLTAAGNPGIVPEFQQFARVPTPNRMYTAITGNPQNSGMGAFAGVHPHMRGQMLHPHMQQHIQAAQAAQAAHQIQQTQQQQQLVAAQQLAMTNQGVNVQAAAQAMSMPQQQVNIPANAATAAAAAAGQQPVNIAVPRPQQKPAFQGMLKIHHFNAQLRSYEKEKKPNDMAHWRKFVADHFSQTGSMRQVLFNSNAKETKVFEIGNPILARYFWELIESGITSLQFTFSEVMSEKPSPNFPGMVNVECGRASMVYWYKDTVCYHNGSFKATLNPALQIELLEFSVTEHHEYIMRSSLQTLPAPSESPDVKASPRSKQVGKRPLAQSQHSKGVAMPEPLHAFGLAKMVIRFLETAETLSCMSDLMMFSRQHPSLTPRNALDTYVRQLQTQQQIQQHHLHQQQLQQQQLQQQQLQQQQLQQQHMAQAAAAANAQGMQNQQQGHPGGPNAGAGGPQMHHSPHMSMVPGMAGSQATGEGRLVTPSPLIGQAPSPAANQLQAPGQQPQQHPISNPSSQNSTTVGSANTSPNQSNKRRRPSNSQNVKNEGDDGNDTANGQKMIVKPSPRMGTNKRVKTNSS